MIFADIDLTLWELRRTHKDSVPVWEEYQCFRHRQTLSGILTLPLISCVTLGNFFNFSKANYLTYNLLSCKMGVIIPTCLIVMTVNELTYLSNQYVGWYIVHFSFSFFSLYVSVVGSNHYKNASKINSALRNSRMLWTRSMRVAWHGYLEDCMSGTLRHFEGEKELWLHWEAFP